MRFSTFRLMVFLMLTVFLVLAGCAKPVSPLVGEWHGRLTMTGAPPQPTPPGEPTPDPATLPALTLNADGTGFMKTRFMPEQVIHWHEADGHKVILDVGGDEAGKSATHFVGTASDGDTTLTVDLGMFSVVLHKDMAARP